jgi:hypothetical protein
LVLAQTHGLNWQAPANDAVVARSAEQPASASASGIAANAIIDVFFAAAEIGITAIAKIPDDAANGP